MKLLADGFAQDNDEAGMSVFFMKNVAAAQPVKFSVSGEGVAPREAQEPPAPDANSGTAPSSETAVGNNKSSWYLIGLLFGVLLGGTVVVFRKRRGSFGDKSGEGAEKRTNQKTSLGKAGLNGSMLDALKEELFQLETDRLDGKISQQDYEKSRAGLDTLIRRQMEKTASRRP
jgi:hypothetical protein